MPSYRVELEIRDLLPGHEPEEVMAAALASIRRRHHVEAHDLDVAAGTARILVRYTVPAVSDAEDDQAARLAAFAAGDDVARVAVVGRLWLLHRDRGRWRPVCLGPA